MAISASQSGGDGRRPGDLDIIKAERPGKAGLASPTESTGVDAAYGASLIWLEGRPGQPALSASAKTLPKLPAAIQARNIAEIEQQPDFRTVTAIMSSLDGQNTSAHQYARNFLNDHVGDARQILKDLRVELAKRDNKATYLAAVSVLTVKDGDLSHLIHEGCTQLVGEKFADIHMTALIVAKREGDRTVSLPDPLHSL